MGNAKPISSEAYLRRGGACCPKCLSSHIESQHDFTCLGAEVTQTVSCLECRATWQDLFSLVGYQELEMPTRTTSVAQ